MSKFKRKLLEVEAIQYNGTNAEEVIAFTGDESVQDHGDSLVIFGRPGTSPHTAHAGDWIVRDVEDYFYVCADSLFRKLYDPA